MQRVHPDLNNSEESLNRSIEIKRIFKGAFENIISNDVSSDIDDDIEEIVEGMFEEEEDIILHEVEDRINKKWDEYIGRIDKEIAAEFNFSKYSCWVSSDNYDIQDIKESIQQRSNVEDYEKSDHDESEMEETIRIMFEGDRI